MKLAALRTLQREIVDKLADFSAAAFGVVAALAWNDAIKTWYATVVKPGDGVGSLFQYAVLITIIGVLITLLIAHIAARLKPKDEVKK